MDSYARYAGLAVAFFCTLVLYCWWNDKLLTVTPISALFFGPKRNTPQDVRATAERLATSMPLEDQEVLPPKTGRRYIVVGGGGFLGGWIATKLLKRGEDAKSIRLLDLSPPSQHPILLDAMNKGLQYIQVDITDAKALEAAFKAPWPTTSKADITVFHTAANIRFYERHLQFLDRSRRVNVGGTKNVIDACRATGVDVLVYTSSGSVGVHSTRLLLWPWEKQPKHFVQVINDDDTLLPKRHEDFFSNYAATKIEAERLVRAADRTANNAQKVIRTGCIRPGNGVFGPRGDMLCGAYLLRPANPSWSGNIMQSFSYVENCAAAHLCYEARLVELQAGTKNPDIGGQAFCVADPGPTPTYGDAYTSLETLTDGDCTFPYLSPTAMLLVAYGFEKYYRAHAALSAAGWRLAKYLPALSGDLVNLQPSIFYLTAVHLIFDDSRARLPPHKGGLGYTGAWTTFEGLNKTYEEFKQSGGKKKDARNAGIGLSFKFGMKKAEKVGKMTDRMADNMPGVAPVEVMPPK
ncbi:hypothetical protein D9613_008649 [Agrocybe pediades]|uniref:3-beta hydroxysteroid dehydrogenase/isomerase domain-containing protein n=1 Tax=Agrocybe pediades TaxID=84607 RepID=A0A8H4QSX1_9AGAR|nr:hypothetical protein D9613_008649 [Agrocybe pediades]